MADGDDAESFKLIIAAYREALRCSSPSERLSAFLDASAARREGEPKTPTQSAVLLVALAQARIRSALIDTRAWRIRLDAEMAAVVQSAGSPVSQGDLLEALAKRLRVSAAARVGAKVGLSGVELCASLAEAHAHLLDPSLHRAPNKERVPVSGLEEDAGNGEETREGGAAALQPTDAPTVCGWLVPLLEVQALFLESVAIEAQRGNTAAKVSLKKARRRLQTSVSHWSSSTMCELSLFKHKNHDSGWPAA